MKYLSEKGYFSTPSCKIMDLGSQNLLSAEPADILEFVARHRSGAIDDFVRAEAERISYFSYPRAGERTAYVSELFDLTDIFYTSYDVCPALKTEIFDLNVEQLPPHYRNFFDVTLNFGTTEHVFHQLNSFRVMHDGMKVGGVAFHQLPSVGWVDHGYFTYHWTFFEDLIRANQYELVDRWYTLAAQTDFEPARIDVRAAESPLVPHSGAMSAIRMPCYLLNVVLRKVQDTPFSVGLELATSHSALSGSISDQYGGASGGLSLGADTEASRTSPLIPDAPVAPQAPQDIVVEPEASIISVAPPPATSGFENVRAKELASELGRRIARRIGL